MASVSSTDWLVCCSFTSATYCELEYLQNTFTFDVHVPLGVIERWELLQAQSRCGQQAGPEEPQQLRCDLDDITSWLEDVIPQLERLQESDPAASFEEMEARAKELKVKFTPSGGFVLIIKKM